MNTSGHSHSTKGQPDICYSISASKPAWPERPVAAGSPNVVIILVDDMGFSDVGCYGSEIPTPNIDSLARGGVRFRAFHSAPICSPTRAALLTGRNPHRAGFGRVASFDPGFPGYAMEFPEESRTLASELGAAGYATFAVGKWHLARELDQSAGGSRNNWPLGVGFDRFYGFLDGFTNFFHPHQLVEDNHHLAIDEYPEGYYLTDDLTSKAIGMIEELRAADDSKPFFLYLAHGAVHAPLQAPEGDIVRFSGVYDDGWDEIRTRRFRRQIEMGLFEDDVALPERGHDIPAWESLDEWGKLFAARCMETYAAMVSSVDRSVGVLRATLERLGEWDRTIVLFLSDNGASSDVGPNGTTRYMLGHGTPIPHDPAIERDNLELIGGPRVFAHYPSGWAWAGNTPFRLYKRNTHAGGHTVPYIVHWPSGNLPAGEIRFGYAHVVDILPTLLDLADVRSQPDGIDGESLAPRFSDDGSEAEKVEQIYESHGNRALYRDGWEIVSEAEPLAPFSDVKWELYHHAADPSQVTDLSSRKTELVASLARRWDELAATGSVFPLEDGSGVFFHQRPPANRPERPVVLFVGMPTLERVRSRDLVWNRDFEIEVAVRSGSEGTLVSHGDQGAGYVLFVERNVLVLAVNAGSKMEYINAGTMPDGPTIIRMKVECRALDRWDVTISVDGVERHRCVGIWMRTGLMTPLHGIDVGVSRGSPVCWDLFDRHRSFPWTGVIDRIVITPGAYSPEAPQLMVERFRSLGMAVEGGDRRVVPGDGRGSAT